MRAGYAFAEGAYLHGAPPERHWVGEARRGLIWGLALPLITIVLFMINMKWALVFLLIYPAQIVRLALTAQTKNGAAWIPAFFLVLGKFPEMIGQLKFFQRRLSGKQGRLIEYK
jgi:hypothetical protein